jgi:hypothetical protein
LDEGKLRGFHGFHSTVGAFLVRLGRKANIPMRDTALDLLPAWELISALWVRTCSQEKNIQDIQRNGFNARWQPNEDIMK